MPRFDLHRNPGASRDRVPFLLNVQSDLIEGLVTRMVIPLRDAADLAGLATPQALMPTFMIEGRKCLLDTPQMASVPARALGPAIGNLSDRRAEIARALDFLFEGL